MSAFADRKDFVDPDTCCFRCARTGENRKLTSGTAFFLRHEHGNDHPYGRECALKVLGNKDGLKDIPDFTRRDGEALGSRGAARSGDGVLQSGVRDLEASEAAAAKCYLLLRTEKVGNIPNIDPRVRYQPLQEIYIEFKKSGILVPEAVTHILAIERKSNTPRDLKTINLLDVYTAEIQLNRAINRSTNPARRAFLERQRSFLRTNLRLTRKQIESTHIKMVPTAFSD